MLAGAPLLRKYNLSYPVPTLACSGELDGLMRSMRMAEAFFHQIEDSRDHNPTVNFPVVVLMGVNHMQWVRCFCLRV